MYLWSLHNITFFVNEVIFLFSNIWVKFNQYAADYAEVNLGQGQPDYAPAEFIQQTLSEVALEGNNYLQYTREQGHLRWEYRLYSVLSCSANP